MCREIESQIEADCDFSGCAAAAARSSALGVPPLFDVTLRADVGSQRESAGLLRDNFDLGTLRKVGETLGRDCPVDICKHMALTVHRAEWPRFTHQHRGFCGSDCDLRLALR